MEHKLTTTLACISTRFLLASTSGLIAAMLTFGAHAAPAAKESGTWKSHLSSDEPEVIFRTYCSACHGLKGDGQTMARFAFKPPPADFTSDKERAELSRAHMIEALNKGAFTKQGKRTAMVAWKEHLNQQQIEAVVDYIIVKFMDGKVVSDTAPTSGHKHKGHDHSAVAISQSAYPYGLKPNPGNGKTIYAANCVKCHGEQGDGQGKAEQVSQIKPRNFKDPDFGQFASGFSLYSAVTKGRGHMPAWDKALSRQDIADVSEFVLQSFVKQH